MTQRQHEPLARVKDKHSHGGKIIDGSPDCYTNNLKDARLHDPAVCPIHGLVAVASGSSLVLTNGLPTARTNIDTVTCGAVITTGSPDTKLS